MPEANQYSVTHKELIELIIKKAEVHEGRWTLSLSVGFSPGNFGPTPDQMSPGVIVGVTSIGIVRETPEMNMPEALTIDAAVVNPRAAKPAAKRRMSKP